MNQSIPNTLNPDYKQAVLDSMKKNYFMQHLGLKPVNIEPGKVEAELELMQHHLQQNGYVHGGITSAISDIVMGFAAWTLVGKGEGTVTSDLKVAYLRPGIGKHVKAQGTVIKTGRNLHYCEASIFCLNESGDETLIARAYATMCTVRHKK